MIIEDENKLVKSVLNRSFFKAWKNRLFERDDKYKLFRNLEVQISAACDLKCTYCYYARFGKHLYPPKITKPKQVLHNLNLLFDWLNENEYYPDIEIFTGEVFAQEAGFKAVEKLIDFYANNNIKTWSTLPSNFSFLFDDAKTRRVEYLLDRGRNKGVYIHLSASVDGKYCDVNRPFKDGRIRDDVYYKKFWEFVKKWNCGLHPMVYSNNIEKWKDNFLWFQENVEKYGLSWKAPYLLEVRNQEWTRQQLKDFYKFYRFITKYAYEKSGVTKKGFPQYAHDNKLFNVFTLFGKVGRGTGCSIQTTIQLRLGDLMHTLCHRAAYTPNELWKFKVENDKIVDIEAINGPLTVAWITADTKNFPMCEQCFLKYMCIGQCWGSMFEVNRDVFVPIPSVCAMEHIKAKAVMDELDDLGILNYYKSFVTKEVEDTINLYQKHFKEKK
jgi:hypothetical protein